MKLVCDRLELSEALGLAASIIPARSPRPALQCVGLRAEPGSLEVLATDLEVSVRAKVTHVDVERPGEALVPAAKATAILRELEGDKVEVASEDRIATIAAEGSRFKIVGEDPQDFPKIPAFDETGAIRFGRAQLEAMIRKTAFAAATEGTRYALNGVLFELRGDVLRLVATDGKRLALCERPVALGGGTPIHVVVPSRGVQLLARLASPEDETIALKFHENQILAASSRASLSAQLVQGHFPPYDGVVPKDMPRKLELEVRTFLAALRRAALLTAKDSRAVRLALSFNKITLSSRTPDVGESTVELPVPYAGDPLEVGFNPDYLMDALKVLDQERVVLELKDDTSPGLLREGEGFTYVAMPISLV